ncbi:MAG: hypothetical protein IPJ16_16690 [Bacteroidales bacterium]|nr:hypothetical protein [Bacteroidales bacterium]
MFKRLIFLLLIILSGCSNPPAPEKKPVTNDSNVKPKTVAPKPVANPWIISSFAPKEGETVGTKFVRFVTEGVFSDSTKTNNYLYAEVLVNKESAGIFLHEMKKSSPSEKFSEPVQIKMTNSEGVELQMTSTRRWNSSGGIMIEKNNNDYSQFRIFLLQNSGIVTVEVKDPGTKIYNFSINTSGFSDSFTKL